MAKPLLYAPKDRWQIWTALGGAALIHLAAVGLAETKSNDSPVVLTVDPIVDGQILPLTEEPQQEPDNPELPLPAPPAPPETTFVDEHVTPAPIRRPTDKRLVPIVKANSPGAARATTMSAAKVFVLSAPRPDYPYEARRRQQTGSGVAVLTVDPANGYVTDVSMSQTTGSPVLDSATIAAFRRWRFKPGTVSTVRTPITFALTGAVY